jgi:hypothetical protein
MLVKDVFTRRIVGFGVERTDIDGVAVCRMFNHTRLGQGLPRRFSTDHDPLFRFHRWRANLRILLLRPAKGATGQWRCRICSFDRWHTVTVKRKNGALYTTCSRPRSAIGCKP